MVKFQCWGLGSIFPQSYNSLQEAPENIQAILALDFNPKVTLLWGDYWLFRKVSDSGKKVLRPLL